MTALKVLILGGYGTFGGRLAGLLSDEAHLTLVIAGRSLREAEAFCASLRGNAKAEPVAFDRDGDVEAALRQLAPDIVVDASGPFQTYGEPYRVVRACLELGVSYLDLADGADFVEGIARFDAEAKARSVFILSGVSSLPVLTAAAARALSKDMMRVEHVSAGIAPSPYAGLGLNVIRAVASYAGKRVAIGPGVSGVALVDSRQYTIAAPGKVPLHPRRFSLVEAPDAKLLPRLWPELRTVWIGVGTVPVVWHRLLNVCARLAGLRLLPPLSSVAGLMHRLINVLRWGEHRGGMFVAVKGVGADGKPIERSWHMIAEGDDGPFIPSMPAAVIIRRCLDGRRPAAGARPATRELELADYDAPFAERRIATGIHEALPASAPVHRRVLGSVWHALPGPIRVMHDVNDELVAEGAAQVERGTGMMAQCVATMFGFPPAGRDVPVSVTFRARDGREVWQRNFAGKKFSSTQEEGEGRFQHLLCERFGPFAIALALVVEDERLRLIVRRWSCLGVPLPSRLAPRGDTCEIVQGGRFNFNVEIDLPLIGLIVRYRGWLAPRINAGG